MKKCPCTVYIPTEAVKLRAFAKPLLLSQTCTVPVKHLFAHGPGCTCIKPWLALLLKRSLCMWVCICLQEIVDTKQQNLIFIYVSFFYSEHMEKLQDWHIIANDLLVCIYFKSKCMFTLSTWKWIKENSVQLKELKWGLQWYYTI